MLNWRFFVAYYCDECASIADALSTSDADLERAVVPVVLSSVGRNSKAGERLLNSDEYGTFTDRLRESLQRDSHVLGLVALGSMAAMDYEPDRWSDHDFFVIVSPGEQERLRSRLDWLPDAERIALAFRETDHGVKVLYLNGHLLEFAVFEPTELRLARVNRYRVLLDRGGVAELIRNVDEATVDAVATERRDDAFLFGMFLSNLLVGVGRFARGERLSGTQFVKGHSIRHLLQLAAKNLQSDRSALLDDLDPFRRAERVFPSFANDVDEALSLPTPRAARALLDCANRTFGSQLGESFQGAVRAVEATLIAAEASAE
jgi:lincosamide nucleotidyltransferase